MGASGWDYRVPYQPDAEAAFTHLQDQVLESGEFLWREEYYGPRPTTRWQLAAIKDREEFWEEGTHSILDMDRIVAAHDEDHDGTLRPLTPDKVRSTLAPTARRRRTSTAFTSIRQAPTCANGPAAGCMPISAAGVDASPFFTTAANRSRSFSLVFQETERAMVAPQGQPTASAKICSAGPAESPLLTLGRITPTTSAVESSGTDCS
jgi:hypothetical protein